jgi:hypothetical protein
MIEVYSKITPLIKELVPFPFKAEELRQFVGIIEFVAAFLLIGLSKFLGSFLLLLVMMFAIFCHVLMKDPIEPFIVPTVTLIMCLVVILTPDKKAIKVN